MADERKRIVIGEPGFWRDGNLLEFYAGDHWDFSRASFEIHMRYKPRTTRGVVLMGEAHLVEYEEDEGLNTAFSPFLRISREEAQALMQAMWNAGIRPKHDELMRPFGNGDPKHLEDMRRIAFGALENIGVKIEK